MKNPIKKLNDFIGDYRWIVIIVFLFMFLNQGSKAVEHLFNIYDNVSEIETVNRRLVDIEDKLSEVVDNTSILYDVEANTAR